MRRINMSMKIRSYGLLGSIIFFGVMYKAWDWCRFDYWCQPERFAFHYNWFIYAGWIGIIINLFAFFFGGPMRLDEGSFLKEVIFRRPSQEELDELYGADRTPEREHAEAHDENERATVFWAVGNTYIDFYGNERDLATREIIRTAAQTGHKRKK
jgi:hypothetical protein